MTKQDFICSLMAIAKEDLKASKLLYDNGLYLQSTFYLQQGIEKGNKAFGLFGEYLQMKDIKDLGHDHTKLHKKTVSHQLEQAKVLQDERVQPILETMNSQFNFNYDNYVNILESSRHIKDQMKDFDITTITEDELFDMYLEIYGIDSELDFEINKKEEIVDEIGKKATEWILLIFEKMKTISPNIDIEEIKELFQKPEVISGMAEAMIKSMEFTKQLMPPFIKIYLLGFITSDLVTKVRYPDIVNNFDPTIIFTAQHPVITLQPKFHSQATKAIEQLSILVDGLLSPDVVLLPN